MNFLKNDLIIFFRKSNECLIFVSHLKQQFKTFILTQLICRKQCLDFSTVEITKNQSGS